MDTINISEEQDMCGRPTDEEAPELCSNVIETKVSTNTDHVKLGGTASLQSDFEATSCETNESRPVVPIVKVKQEPIEPESSSLPLADYPICDTKLHEVLTDVHNVEIKQEPVESESSLLEMAHYPDNACEPLGIRQVIKQEPDERDTTSVDVNQFCQPLLLQSEQDKKQEDLLRIATPSQPGELDNVVDKHGREKLWACGHCDKRFIHRCYLVKHEQIHSGLKPFGCNNCDKKFTYRSNLARHLKIHSGLKPYACKECDKMFSQHCHLKRHMLVHTGEKPYACSECDMKFTQHINLKTHMEVHNVVDVFSCHMCKKWFIDDYCLKRHKNIYSGITFFVCDICDKKFPDSSNLAIMADNDLLLTS